MGTPSAQSKIQPSFPLWAAFFVRYFIKRQCIVRGGIGGWKIYATHPEALCRTIRIVMKISRIVLTLAFSSTFFFAACEEKKPRVVEKPIPETINIETTRVGAAIDSYISSPTAVHAADVDRAFAKLEGEVTELSQRLARTSDPEVKMKSDNLRAYRDRERLRYTEAQTRAKVDAVKRGTQDVGDKVEDAARKAGEGVKDAADTVKDGVKDALDTVKEKLP